MVGPNGTLIPPPPTADPRVGLVNYWPDPIDGKLRAAIFTISDRQFAGLAPFAGEEVFKSFDARGLEQLGHGADVPSDQRAHMLRFSRADAYPPRPLYEVFDPRLWRANYQNGAFFKNKVVLIGAASQIAHDVVSTPLSPNTLGPELHLETMAAALAHEFLRPTPARWMFILVGQRVHAPGFSSRSLGGRSLVSLARPWGRLLSGQPADMTARISPPYRAGLEHVPAQRIILAGLRVCARTVGETAHPPHPRALRLEKPGQGNPR
jgi:hypothetical protein